MSSRDITPKKKSRPKVELEPISMDEILAGAGMSGFVSILDPPEDVPHLQALVDDIRDMPLLAGSEMRGNPARGSEAEAVPGGRLPGSRLERKPHAQVIHQRRRETGPGELFDAEDEASPEVKRVPGAERDTRPPPPPIDDSAAAGKRYHVRRAVLAQDGHSSGEEMLYQSLWNSRYTRQESKETRLVTIGWKAMAKLARLTPRNTRRNCQSLIDKLAVEQLSEENSRESIGRTYRLFSYKAILERRRAAGLEWVTRSRGVVFVPAPVKAAAPAATGREMPSKANAGDVGGTKPGVDIAPDAKRVPGAERDTGSQNSDTIVRTLREYLPDVDDASVLALVDACRQKAPDASPEEINYFVRIKADLMQRMGTVKSPMGFLKTSVPRCFEGESFRQFREAEVKRREAAALRDAAQEEELRRFQEEQRAILEDPKSSEEERRFARNYLGI
jgi:hypothetical protein